MLAGLSGRVIEVGAGNGLNLPHYPQAVREVVAVEPEPYLRARAADAAAAAPVPVRVTDGTAGDLPAADGEFDTVVVSGRLTTRAKSQAGLSVTRLPPGHGQGRGNSRTRKGAIRISTCPPGSLPFAQGLTGTFGGHDGHRSPG